MEKPLGLLLFLLKKGPQFRQLLQVSHSLPNLQAEPRHPKIAGNDRLPWATHGLLWTVSPGKYRTNATKCYKIARSF